MVQHHHQWMQYHKYYLNHNKYCNMTRKKITKIVLQTTRQKKQVKTSQNIPFEVNNVQSINSSPLFERRFTNSGDN